MKTKRIKAPTIETRIDFETLIDRIALATTELRRCEALRDQLVQRAQASFSTNIAGLQKAIAANATLCEKYAEEHRDELLPGKAKSAETPLARFGFALANKKSVKPTSKKIEEETIIASLKANHLEDYVRQLEEIAKDKILSDACYDEELQAYVLVTSLGSRVILGEIGLKLVQAETFFIEPKVDGAEQVKGGAS